MTTVEEISEHEEVRAELTAFVRGESGSSDEEITLKEFLMDVLTSSIDSPSCPQPRSTSVPEVGVDSEFDVLA